MSRGGSFPRRGSVYRATLRLVRGREIALRRPVVLVSNDHMNELAETVLVMPITSGRYSEYVHWIPVDPPEGGLIVPSRVVTDQIRALDKRRLGRRLGALRRETMAKIEDAIRDHFGLPEGRGLPEVGISKWGQAPRPMGKSRVFQKEAGASPHFEIVSN